MNVYNYIGEQGKDICISELAEYLCNKYNLNSDDVEYHEEHLGYESYLNRYTLKMDLHEIDIYSDNEIFIIDNRHGIIDSKSKSNITKNDIICFFKTYKRKKIIDELL